MEDDNANKRKTDHSEMNGVSPPSTSTHRQENSCISPSDDEELDEFQTDQFKYDMNAPKAGRCLIFNHKIYKNKPSTIRRGSEKDAKDLVECFETLGFETQLYQDPRAIGQGPPLTKARVMETLGQESRRDHSEHNMFVLCIMTHGIDSETLEAFDQSYKIREILKHFECSKCPTLAEKAKIIIIQACQGTLLNKPVSKKGFQRDSDEPSPCAEFIPNVSDFIICHATNPSFGAVRDPEHGSWYIQTLVKVLRRHAAPSPNSPFPQLDLVTMLTFVNDQVANKRAQVKIDGKNEQVMQMPSFQSMLRKHLYFPSTEAILHKRLKS